VGSAAVWGGEDNDPPQYGRVFIAIRPTTGTALTQFEKTAIIDTVIKPKKILTVQTEIIDPEFIFLTVTANVKFDPRLTTVTGESLRSSVIETIKKYNDDDLDQFSKYFRYSKLTKLIDNTERSILNNSITVRLRQEVPIQLDVGTRYEINFSNPINSVTRGRPVTFPFGVVSQISTNGFTFQGLPNCFLEENNGIIRVFRIVRTDIVGVAQNIGTIDYATGKIILTNFAPNAFADGGTTLRITAVPSELDILPLRGQILTIQDTDITVNITDDTQISLVRR
jgi:archaellin